MNTLARRPPAWLAGLPVLPADRVRLNPQTGSCLSAGVPSSGVRRSPLYRTNAPHKQPPAARPAAPAAKPAAPKRKWDQPRALFGHTLRVALSKSSAIG